ncbi:MAG: ImmA/IrrE family metallo-endopeptidase [Ruminococcus sp.]|nr:ImmA/IrrE family metallo-endopeptidase [Ruminococcus sp.]
MIYLRSEEIDKLASSVIRKYKEYVGIEWELFSVDPMKLAEMCGCEIKFIDFGDETDTLGFTAFNDMTITAVDVNQTEIRLDLTDKSIVINEALKRGCEGRVHFTIAHEIAHHIINKVCSANYSFKYRQLPHFEKKNNRYSPDYDEYMANQLAAAILMPSNCVNIVFTKAFGTNRVERIHSILDKVNFQKFCAIAALFGVSKEALAIRLQKKGMLGDYIFAGYESLLDVFPSPDETAA